ncbi:MAG TPA: class I SAM-dependent methyltransferase [Phycisphaerae bacterium]|nr:class I SAM-dependent methyltransferase [Phycisphaerae bacterium]
MPRTVQRRLEGSAAALCLRRTVGPSKYEAELGFWRSEHRRTGGNLRNDAYYRNLTTRVGRLERGFSFRDKVVVDIGCGPRGSLCWIEDARLKLGIDPLNDAYRDLGIGQHPMNYLAACGEAIPLRDAVVDVVITINALDHVEDAASAMSEIRRILKPGGTFIGSIGLRTVPTGTEPCLISREMVHAGLLAGWRIDYEHVFPECDAANDAYRYADEPPPPNYRPEVYVLWCRATRPSA